MWIEVSNMRRPVTGLAACVAATWLAACGGAAGSPEDEIRAWVRQGTEFVEAENRRGLVGMISTAYADGRGNTRDDLDDRFRLVFLRANNITLLTSIDEIRLHGDSAADVLLTVGMAGTDGGFLGIDADAYRFEMELERDGGDWQLIGARWAELGEEMR
ncbi:MAG: hypothetical protein R3176_08065 [Woeseiaceae bacterium]|nr:hypothetical protein [Woeseiaceae bacterium]